MKYSIDRIEENIAICEGDDGYVLKLKLDELPKGTREGDIIEKTENGFIIDADETQLRRKKMAEREGFEPPVPLGTTVFKTVVIDHSTISPNLHNDL